MGWGLLRQMVVGLHNPDRVDNILKMHCPLMARYKSYLRVTQIKYLNVFTEYIRMDLVE